MQRVLSTICLHVNWKAHVACNFICLLENAGLSGVTASRVYTVNMVIYRKRGKMEWLLLYRSLIGSDIWFIK